jgi:predicted PurR-regulated permease PerM
MHDSPLQPSVTNESPRALILWTLVVTAAIVMVIWVLFHARQALLLIYVSGLLAAGISPIVRLIERRQAFPFTRRVPRWLAILSIYLTIVLVLTGIALMVLPPLVRQARDLWMQLPFLIDRVQLFLIEWGVFERPVTFEEAVERAPATGDAMEVVFDAVEGLIGGIVGFVSILILTFYMLLESNRIFRTFVRLFPPARRERVSTLLYQITTKLSAWLVGQLLVAGIIGATAALGLFVMGVPYFYVLALIAAVGELIPIIGPLLASIPAIIVAFTVSPMLAGGVAVFFIVQQQLEGHVLVPKLMERQVGVAALAVVVSILIGGTLLGLLGIVLAVPTAAIIQALFEELVAPDDTGTSGDAST